MNESTQSQDVVFRILSAAYAFVSAVSLIQLIRIQSRVPEYGWTTQKVFHLMNFIVHGAHAAVFGFHMFVFVLKPKVLTLVSLDLPGLLLFTTFTLLILFWAQVYHQAKSLPVVAIDRPKAWYMSVNCIVYVIQVSIWTCLWVNDNSFVGFISQVFISVASFIAALGFLFFGGRLFLMLWRFPAESRGRLAKLHEVGSATAICFTCFLIRCLMVVVSAFDADASLKVLDHPIRGLIYYTLAEILPSGLVLFIIRKMPPKRKSA